MSLVQYYNTEKDKSIISSCLFLVRHSPGIWPFSSNWVQAVCISLIRIVLTLSRNTLLECISLGSATQIEQKKGIFKDNQKIRSTRIQINLERKKNSPTSSRAAFAVSYDEKSSFDETKPMSDSPKIVWAILCYIS